VKILKNFNFLFEKFKPLAHRISKIQAGFYRKKNTPQKQRPHKNKDPTKTKTPQKQRTEDKISFFII